MRPHSALTSASDSNRLPVELVAKIFVGSIRATMSKRFWLDPAKATAEKESAAKQKK